MQTFGFQNKYKVILFYAAELDDNEALLIESEAIHCRQALRKQVGEVIHITDGKGKAFKAEIVEIGKKTVRTIIKNAIHLNDARAYKIHLVIAPTKNISRMEWLLEKATEIGIDSITPILCSRSERKVIKEERLRKILISAMKQSLKSSIPELKPLIKFQDFINQEIPGKKIIAHLDEESQPIYFVYKKGENVTILIGPEGDFTEGELDLAKAHNYQKSSLGNYRLRTETAGLVAIQTIHTLNALK